MKRNDASWRGRIISATPRGDCQFATNEYVADFVRHMTDGMLSARRHDRMQAYGCAANRAVGLQYPILFLDVMDR